MATSKFSLTKDTTSDILLTLKFYIYHLFISNKCQLTTFTSDLQELRLLERPILQPNQWHRCDSNKNLNLNRLLWLFFFLHNDSLFLQMLHRSLPSLTKTSHCFSSRRTFAGDFELWQGCWARGEKKVPFFWPVVFVSRSVSAGYQLTTELQGIPVYRFTLQPDTLAAPVDNPDNQCYCTDEKVTKNCTVAGALDVGACKSQ